MISRHILHSTFPQHLTLSQKPIGMDFLPTLSIFTFLFFLLMVKKIRNGFGKRNTVSRLPPGPWKLPVIGSIHHLLGSLPHRALRNLSNRYGPFMEFQLAQVPALIVSSSESAKEIMKINDLNFAQRPELYAMKIMTYGCTDMGFAPYGKYWRELRKLCVLELFTAKRVESFKPVREEEVLNLMKFLSLSSNSPVNLTGEFYSLTNNITARVAFGNKSEHQARFLQVMGKVIKLSSGFNVVDLFPSFSFIPVITGTKKKVDEIHRELDGIFNDIIEEHRQQGVGKDGQEDLVDVLLRVQEQGNLEVPITIDNIKAIIFDIFVGGTETSSTSLGWIMAELMKNPTIMAKAQDEVRSVVRGNITVLESDISQLNYLKLVVKEALRLHPPLPLVLPRESRETIKISGYKIPAKTKVIVNAWAIGRDPKQWGDDAETFKPERFLHVSTDFKGANFDFIPFGAGRRMCPGVLFGLANVELPLAQLLYHFDWKLPNGIKHEDLDMTESFAATVCLKSDLFLVPILCNPLPHD